MKNEKVTLMVSECSEFHGYGEYHENIETVDEAIRLFNRIPDERMHAIKAIGIRVEDSCDPLESMEYDMVYSKAIDLDTIEYYPDILESKRACEMISELVKKMPDKEIRGEVPEAVKDVMEQTKGHSVIGRRHCR